MILLQRHLHLVRGFPSHGPLWSLVVLVVLVSEGGVKEALLSQTGQCSRIEEKWSSQLQALQVFQLKSSGRFLMDDPRIV
jgi:hypothetical protein